MHKNINDSLPRPLSIGFIGGAQNSAVGYAHFVACRMDNRWQLDAGCFSTHPEQNHESATRYGVAPERNYGDWHEMLQQERSRLDAILVVTPTPAHREMVGACLEAGIPVICEKALARNPAESGELLQLRQKHQGFLGVTFNYSGYPMMRELREKIARGDLGDILHFQVEMPQEGFVRTSIDGKRPTPQDWRLHDGTVPTLGLDLMVHLHHAIRYLLQARPISVVADHASEGWFRDIIDDYACLAHYEHNIRGQFWFSKSSLGHRNGLRLRIYGTKASAEWFQANPEELLISHIDGRREILDRAGNVVLAALPRYNRFKSGHPAGFIEAFANLYVDFADALTEFRATGQWSEEQKYGAHVAHEGLLLLDAMERSCHSKRWEDISLTN
ncbi:MAG TPA: Gfo/Idh/MocA family oxidoreductase [Rhodocyclaceae bacterium]|jgi:predicted dehydrogenase|nr:Gfo/Idh/MocA family oxidoreductase [Rhodocyclaceae bacterium]